MKGPNGRKWGEVIRIHLAPNGNIWVFHRCFHDKPSGDATCLNRGDANPPILEFNPAGRLLKSFGVGLFAHPHGFTVDKDGNLWATDSNDQETILGMPAKNAQGVAMGQTVLKISPAGKVLMTIGTPGVGGDGPNLFDRPTGVSIAANGDIFVADGHAPNKSNSGRIVKFSPKGTFIKAWGRLGSEPGNFRDPHDLYVGGSKGYVYVADRQNNRVQVFDQNGTFIDGLDPVRAAELRVRGRARQHLRRRHLSGPVPRRVGDRADERAERPRDRGRQRHHRRAQVPDSRPGRSHQDDRHRHVGVGHRGGRPGQHLRRRRRLQQPAQIREERTMRRLAFSLLGLAVLSAPPAEVRAQRSEYPLILVPTAKGPFTFPPGYQTPWDQIEIMVTEKMSPNLFVLHGSQGLDAAHPDASGGRAMVLFGPDGVLMVDTQNRQVAEKTLRAIRSFTSAPIRILVNTHVHSDHTGANAFFAKQGALIYAQENLRNEMLRPPPRARPAGAGSRTWPRFR